MQNPTPKRFSQKTVFSKTFKYKVNRHSNHERFILFAPRSLPFTVSDNANCEGFSSGPKKNTIIFFGTEHCSLQSRKIRTVKGLARVKKKHCFSNRKLQSTVKTIRTVKGLARVIFFEQNVAVYSQKKLNCERFSSGQFFLNRTLQSTVKKN